MKFVRRRCPLCSLDSSRDLLTDINRREGLQVSGTLVDCRSCGMRYLNPTPDAVSLAELYQNGSVDPVVVDADELRPASRVRARPGSLQRTMHSINGVLRGHPHDWPEEEGQGRSILDFGCHDGGKLAYWHQRGWQVAGLDLNERAIEVARQKLPEGRFSCGDLLASDIDDRFDVIRADNVIEHLLDPVAYLTALRKLLKPGGRLRVFVPNGMALSALLFGRYSYVYWMPLHLNLFTRRTLKLSLQAAGFADFSCFTFSPIGSWMHTQRQLLLRPGYNRRSESRPDRVLKGLRLLNYPGETSAQWLGMGEELIGTGGHQSSI